MTAESRRFAPYPELVEETHQADPYEIIDTTDQDWLPTNGMTDKMGRKLLVPLNPDGGPTTCHEMAHVLWSPTKIPKVRYNRNIFLAVEDARINMGLELIGLQLTLSADDRAYVGRLAARDLERGDAAGFILRAIASLGTNADMEALQPVFGVDAELGDLATRLMDSVQDKLTSGRARVGQPVTSVKDTIRIARWVASELKKHGHECGEDLVVTGHGCCLEHGEGKPGQRVSRSVLEALGIELPDRFSDRVHPGIMTEVVAPLDVLCVEPRAGAGRRWSAATEGSVVSSVHRFSIDRAIFRRRIRQRGGSVLVDTSGSMSLGSKGVDKILSHAPHATLVAIYSGHAALGELRIVARGGRRATAENLEPYAKGNIVDVPALEWLARQPWPRIWITDGGVTGVNDTGSRKIREMCDDICRRANIREVATVKEASELLKQRVRVSA